MNMDDPEERVEWLHTASHNDPRTINYGYYEDTHAPREGYRSWKEGRREQRFIANYSEMCFSVHFVLTPSGGRNGSFDVKISSENFNYFSDQSDERDGGGGGGLFRWSAGGR